MFCARREVLLSEARQTIEKETGAEVLAVPSDVQRLEDVQRLGPRSCTASGLLEVANIVVFLASERPSYMNGTCVTVDGGVTRGILIV